MTKLPDTITIQKIDFVIRAVQEGKFDEEIKKIEFVNKLDGQHTPPTFLKDLLGDIVVSHTNELNMSRKVTDLENKVRLLEEKIGRYDSDMNTIGKALSYLFKPEPMAKSYDLSTIQSWLSGKGIY